MDVKDMLKEIAAYDQDIHNIRTQKISLLEQLGAQFKHEMKDLLERYNASLEFSYRMDDLDRLRMSITIDGYDMRSIPLDDYTLTATTLYRCAEDE